MCRISVLLVSRMWHLRKVACCGSSLKAVGKQIEIVFTVVKCLRVVCSINFARVWVFPRDIDSEAPKAEIETFFTSSNHPIKAGRTVLGGG